MPNVVPKVTPFKRILVGQPRRVLESHVRLRPQVADHAVLAQAYEVLDTVGEELITLSLRLESLDSGLRAVSYDPSACAAAQTGLSRSREIAELVDLLFMVQVTCSSPAPALLLAGGGPLADYLLGVVAWSSAVVRALEELTVELKVYAPDWAKLRHRLHDASTFLLGELVRAIRDDLDSLAHERPDAVLAELRASLDELFAATEALSVSLQRRFG